MCCLSISLHVTWGARRVVQAVGSPPPYRAHSAPAWGLAVMNQDEGEHCSSFCRGDRSLCSLSVKSWLKAQGEACQHPLLRFHGAWKGGMSALQPAYGHKTKFRTNPPSSMTDATLLWTCWRAEPTTDIFPRLFGILKGSYLKRNGVQVWVKSVIQKINLADFVEVAGQKEGAWWVEEDMKRSNSGFFSY